LGSCFEFEYGKDKGEGVLVVVEEGLEYCIVDYE